jgi:hypothetical protein
MDPRLFILTQIYEDFRPLRLVDDLGSPSWSDWKFFRLCILRLKRNEGDAAWQEFLDRLRTSADLTGAVRSTLFDLLVVYEVPDTDQMDLSLPSHVTPLPDADKKQLLRLLDERDREQDAPANPFEPPRKASRGDIMYIEMKPGLQGPARIARVQFSKTRKTIYYDGKKLQSLKGRGFKANYIDIDTSMEYWISKCRKDGNDSLYGGIVEIDDDAREEYWTQIRQQPENKHLTSFRSPGKVC